MCMYFCRFTSLIYEMSYIVEWYRDLIDNKYGDYNFRIIFKKCYMLMLKKKLNYIIY